MKKIFIVGLNGKMGRWLIDMAPSYGLEVSGGVDLVAHPLIATFQDAKSVNVDFDAIIDFSRPQTLETTIDLALSRKAPVVIATTGYNGEQMSKIAELSKSVAVFQSGNMSLGINVLLKLTKAAVKGLKDFDVEITEKHHNMKVDAPSGTAKMIADAANEAMDGKANFVYGRYGDNAPRSKNDIGINAIRGGTIVGEHEVLFCGQDEIITLTHTALSRKVFASGALSAVLYLDNKPSGLYNMNDLLSNI